MRKVAVVLSGCGYKDGSEITEAVSALIALSEAGAKVFSFSPQREFTSVDHLSGQALPQKRQALSEAARITRGQIQDLANLRAQDFDALVFPGGFGAALTLSSWGTKGAQCEVLPEVSRVIEEFYRESKPIGAICIAPTLVAKVLGKHGVTLTIGNDPETAQEIEKTGARHENCKVDDYVTDREHKVITTPAYMYDNAPVHLIFAGIRSAMKELVEMA